MDATRVVVAGRGAVNVAPEGSTLPTNESTALDAAFVELGYASENGVTMTRDRTTNDLAAWQSADPVRILTTAVTMTVAVELMEYSMDNLIEAYSGGSGNSTATRGTYTFPASVDPLIRALVVDWFDGLNAFRFVAPRAQVQGSVATQLQRGGGALLPVEYRILASTPVPVIYGTGEGWVT